MAAAATRDKSSEELDGLLGGSAPFAGKYAVERILGIGGMGTVFEARHIRLGHRVAIKVLGSELRDYPELVTRFEREARAAGSLSSRHAVRVFDIDMTEDATPFIVMELLSGQDLARIIEREGPQPVGRAVRWLIEACDAIAEAHRLGIIHRDLKPSNLFLTDEGVKVLDFGIAKRVAAKEASITHAVAPLGTPQYMSPEQVRCAKDVDARTDVWSLGVTLYELLTGRTPFAHEISQACIASIAADPVPDPRTFRADLPPELVDVIMKALAKNPDERWASVAELVNGLAPFAELDADDEPSTAVRKVIASATRALRGDESTLDGGITAPPMPMELLESGVRPSALPIAPSTPVPSAQNVRRPADSDASLPPPAITKVPPPAKRRLRSSLAVATAAVLGLAALVITPRCVKSNVDGAQTASLAGPRSAVTNGVPTVKIETVALAPSVASALATEEQANDAADVAPVPVKDARPTAVVPAPTVIMKKSAPAPTTTASVRTSTTSNAKTPRPDTTARLYGDSPVHGGLSNPGF